MKTSFLNKAFSLLLITAVVGFSTSHIILPTAFAATNLVTNGDASSLNLSGWTVTRSCGNGWSAAGGSFVSSYYMNGGYAVNSNPSGWCAMEQQIDLLGAGYSADYLDAGNDIKVGTQVYGYDNGIGTSYDDFYSFRVVLKDATGGTIDTYDTYVAGVENNRVGVAGPDGGVGQPAHVFSGYGSGVRYIYIQQRGVDVGFWSGNSGAYFDNTYAEFGPSVTTFSPADNSTTMQPDANLVMTFNEPVNVGTGNIKIKKASDNSTLQTIDVTSGQVTGGGTSTITIAQSGNPEEDMFRGEGYYVLIDSTAFVGASSGDPYAGISSTTRWNFTIAKVAQVISFDELAAKNYGDTPFDLIATASSGLAVSYASSNTDVATIDGSTLTIVGPGTTTITASQAGNSNYAAASDVERTLTVNATAPILSTTPASSITTTTATSGGEISSDGGAEINARGICISMSENPTTANTCTADGIGAGAFVSSFISLTDHTTYHLRAYATNSVGTAYGNDVTFTTIAIPGGASLPTPQKAKKASLEKLNSTSLKDCSDLAKEYWAYTFIKSLLDSNMYPVVSDNNTILCQPKQESTRAEIVRWLVLITNPEAVATLKYAKLETSPFSDLTVENEYTPYIIVAKETGIISGYADGTFRPDSKINRAGLLKILLGKLKKVEGTKEEVKLLKEKFPDRDPVKLFADIKDENAWFYPYLYYATANNIIEGRTYIIDGKQVKKADMSSNPSNDEVAKILVLVNKAS